MVTPEGLRADTPLSNCFKPKAFYKQKDPGTAAGKEFRVPRPGRVGASRFLSQLWEPPPLPPPGPDLSSPPASLTFRINGIKQLGPSEACNLQPAEPEPH